MSDVKDVMDKLTDGLKSDIIETCAKVATIHRIPRPENEFQRGYNEAVADIASRIRRL